MNTIPTLGDTAWILLSTLLVFLMLPGFALFYGGLERERQVFPLLTRGFMALCLVTLQWVLFGYSLSFGPDHNGWIGTLAWAGLRGVGAEPNLEYTNTVPHLALMMYRGMVAAITPTILLGVFAERIKFSSFIVFALLWTTLVYDPVAHWVWSVSGFLRSSGVLDFGGGCVVHLSAGMSAWAVAIVLGKRQESSSSSSAASNIPSAILGGIILWLGWFGLNAGNAIVSGDLAANAFLATHVAAITGGLTWSLLERGFDKQTTLLGLFTGAIAGMVAAAPAAGFVSLWEAIAVGFGASALVYAFLTFMEKRFGQGSALFPVGIHGLGGLWGMVGAGLLVTQAAGPLLQMKAAVAVALYSFGMSFLLLKIMDFVMGLEPTKRKRPAEDF